MDRVWGADYSLMYKHQVTSTRRIEYQGTPPGDKMTTAQSLFDKPGSMEEELYNAVKTMDLLTVKLLIQDGADVCWKKSWPGDGDCALHQAALQGHETIMNALLTAGANVCQLDDRGRTALHKAASMGHVASIQRLIAAGANCNHSDFDDVTPLHLACSGNHPAAVRSLLLAGAEANRNYSGEYSIPLIYSASHGHLECVKVLVEHGADVNWMDRSMRSAVNVAARNGHEDCLSYLVTHGADMDGEDDGESTPLFHAASKKHSACMDLLVTAGADCVAAVQCAASRREWRTVEVLLENTERPPSRFVLMAAISDIRLSTVAKCIQRGSWADETDVVGALVQPIVMDNLNSFDMSPRSWSNFAHIKNSQVDILVELLELLHEVGAISAWTLYRQLEALGIYDRPQKATTLKNICAWVIRRHVRGPQGEVYKQLGLPKLLMEFVANQPRVEKYKSIPPVLWNR